MGYTTPYYPHGIYHSILSSWDKPLHIILMHSIPYYPHGRITPPIPIQLYNTTPDLGKFGKAVVHHRINLNQKPY